LVATVACDAIAVMSVKGHPNIRTRVRQNRGANERDQSGPRSTARPYDKLDIKIKPAAMPRQIGCSMPARTAPRSANNSINAVRRAYAQKGKSRRTKQETS